MIGTTTLANLATLRDFRSGAFTLRPDDHFEEG